eukprot:g13219.t1
MVKSVFVVPLMRSDQKAFNVRAFSGIDGSWSLHRKKAAQYCADIGAPLPPDGWAGAALDALKTSIANHVDLALSGQIAEEAPEEQQMVDLYRWMLRQWSSIVARTRGETISDYKDLFGIPGDEKAMFWTIAHDDATRRKHSQKLPNHFTAKLQEDGSMSLRYDPLPYQQTKSGPKKGKKDKDRKKSKEETQFLFEAVGFLYGSEVVAEMLLDAKEFDVERWKKQEARVFSVMVDQASWEMCCWQVGSELLHMVFAEAEAHRDSNSAEPKSKIMLNIARAIRSFMRGPKGKRANLGAMRDTRLRMLARAKDSSKPVPKWKWMREAMKEAEDRGDLSDLVSVLDLALPMQSSVDKRWLRTRCVSLFLKKYRLRLAFILEHMSIADMEANTRAAGEAAGTDEDHLDLPDLSSDEEGDSQVTGDHVYLLKCLEPILKSTLPMDAAIAFSNEAHERYALLQSFQQLTPGKPMSADLAKRASKWLGQQYAEGSPVPETNVINRRRAITRWLQNRKLIADCCVVGGKFASYGITEMMDSLRKHVNFAAFQAADPQFGYWETRIFNQRPGFPIAHRWAAPLSTYVKSLSYKPGALAKHMAELHDQRLLEPMQRVVEGSLNCRPLNENETEKPHTERLSNNDRRCKVDGANYSTQRDRLRDGLRHDRYVKPDDVPHEYTTGIDRLETIMEETNHGSLDYMQSCARQSQPMSGAQLRNTMKHWKTCFDNHHSVADLPEYKGLGDRFKNAAPSRNADRLGQRGAEFLARLEFRGPLSFECARALSRRISDEQATSYRLDNGFPVLVLSTIQKDTPYQIIHDDSGILQMLKLDRATCQELLQTPGSAQLAADPLIVESGSYFNYPREEDTEVKCGLLCDYELLQSGAKVATSATRRSVIFRVDDEAVLDFDDNTASVYPALSSAHKLEILSGYLKDHSSSSRRVSKAELDFLQDDKQAALFNMIRQDANKVDKCLNIIKENREKEIGVIVEKVSKLREEAAKKRKTDKDQPNLQYEMKDSPRKPRDEDGGRMAAAFTADVLHKGVPVCEIRSHRVGGGEQACRLKLMWNDHDPETCARTMSRKWLTNTDPLPVAREFLSYIVDELGCSMEQLEIRVTKTNGDAGSSQAGPPT